MSFPERNADCHVKFGYILGDPIFVVKISSGFYDNPKMGLPSNNGIVIAMSAETGEVVSVLDDRGLMTEIRTAVGGAIATLSLSRPDANTIGIVGTGTQARQHIRALATIADKPLQFIVWGRDRRRAEALREEVSHEGYSVEVLTDVEDLCGRVHAIVTTTQSTEPILQSSWIRPGTHITAVGADAPGKQELDTSLVVRADRLIVDLAEQCLDHGEFSHANREGLIDPARCVELGSFLAGQASGRLTSNEITIADLTGLAAQDIAITRVVLEKLGSAAQ